ncbi:MAG: hypothetical protein SVX38_09015 [Chloroflexota bacterium]|nr:hypothetical protein [Chloroflexota bacterium]
MQVYAILWTIVCLIIGVLALLLIRALRESEQGERPGVPLPPGGEGRFEEEKEPLLLYYDEVESGLQGIRSKNLLLRMPPAAWKTDWREDLIRVEVTSQDPTRYALAPEVKGHLERVYHLSAMRMSESGADFEIVSFPHPLDLVLSAEVDHEGAEAQVMEWADGLWKSLPRVEMAVEFIEPMFDPAARCWAAAHIESLGVFGLVR